MMDECMMLDDLWNEGRREWCRWYYIMVKLENFGNYK